MTTVAFGDADDGFQDVAPVAGASLAVTRVRYYGAPPEVWMTDGSEAHLIKTMPSNDTIQNFFAAGNLVFFSRLAGSAPELWKSDGTAEGTVVIKTFDGGINGWPIPLGTEAGMYYFRGKSTAAGSELWRSDGTTSGTVMVADIAPGTADSQPNEFANYAGRVYFAANDGVHGSELWTSDGTAGGTYQLADTLPGPDTGDAWSMFGRGGRLYYIACPDADCNTGDLWSVDYLARNTQARVGGGAATLSDVWELRPVSATVYLIGRKDEVQTADGTLPAVNLYRMDLPPASVASMPGSPTLTKLRKAARVTWRPALSPDTTLTGYRIQVFRKASGGAAIKSITVGAGVTTYTVTGLKARKRYWFTVTPLTASGSGRGSTRVKTTTR